MAAAPIILIDDEPAHLLVTQKYLTRAGATHPIITFKDSELALAFLRGATHAAAQRPAIVFCDLRMPLLDGFDLLAWTRQQPQLQDMPFVILTSSDDAKDLTRAEELGADAYLVKFPKVERFAEILAQFLPKA